MKKKILTIAIALICALLVVGSSLAYFTDTDAKKNTFEVGNVEIELIESFGDDNPQTPEKLIPATGSAQAGTLQNGIKKEVTVKNIGTEDAYVRVHIAIPNILDSGNPEFDAGKNVLHFNFSSESVTGGLWNWTTSVGSPYYGNPWNYYEKVIDGVNYNVYVVTYEPILSPNEVTSEKAMTQVYLDSKVTNADVEAIIAAIGENWNILVIAEGVQAAGFNDAYAALNAAFGVPGSYDAFAGATFVPQ